MSLKTIRTLIHNKKYNEIPELLGEIDIENITLDYLNSIISGISKITEWNIEIPFNDFISNILKKTHILKWNETTYTSIINLYSNTLFHNMDECMKYLNIMIEKNIIIKKRTLYPLFNLGYFLKDTSFLKDLYLLSKINNIVIDINNYIQLIEIFKDKFIFKEIIKDFFNYYSLLNEDNIISLQKIFSNRISLKEEINYNKYTISTKMKTNILSQIENFIKLSLKNKTHINKFIKFISTIKKKNIIIIDGANLGYYKQGTNSGVKINFKQILDFIKCLNDLGENNILLVLSINHFTNLNSTDNNIVKELQKRINIYKTPKGVDDDYFWLYSLVYFNDSRVLTNDEISNHLFYLNNNITDLKKYKFIKYDINESNNILLYFPTEYLINSYYNDNKLIIPYEKNTKIEWITFNLV